MIEDDYISGSFVFHSMINKGIILKDTFGILATYKEKLSKVSVQLSERVLMRTVYSINESCRYIESLIIEIVCRFDNFEISMTSTSESSRCLFVTLLPVSIMPMIRETSKYLLITFNITFSRLKKEDCCAILDFF